ncbi:flavodoxin family protein [Cryobacterium lactosi]|uniref:Flavodoxin family protein n=1 Tax=Cryobacterium lactosi TaxID=1259202 RepID=A0A4R9BLU9_9MICO|nr:NAD(P)H-dependent oxidoreductase [Cryobacterium lactosi]TFD87042.1 flavodoxin family protein [Cryobacterium lactosi]
MSLFRLDASIREHGSASSALADLVEKHWQGTAPDAPVSRRHIGVNPLPSDAWATALTAAGTPDGDRTDHQRQALTLAGTLIDELDQADAYLFAVPLYNFGPSQHFKTYVDLVTTDPRMAPGVASVTAGKPGVLVTVQGGNYSPGTPKAGWDHATDWMRRILEDVWHIDLRIVSREFTLVGVNPALDAFADVAEHIKSDAEQRAREHGQTLATRQRAA